MQETIEGEKHRGATAQPHPEPLAGGGFVLQIREMRQDAFGSQRWGIPGTMSVTGRRRVETLSV
ncbi:MAG: hypothetical protein KDA58_06130 [Planctomycetaceae bacterium]|nr:hypothetical protein [Planctomycetaceae bacterium]